MVIIEIPDDFLELTISQLPGDWRDYPAPPATKDFGSVLLNKGEYLVFKIPSSVIPQEYNYLINPRHPHLKECKIIEARDFVYDARIKNV